LHDRGPSRPPAPRTEPDGQSSHAAGRRPRWDPPVLDRELRRERRGARAELATRLPAADDHPARRARRVPRPAPLSARPVSQVPAATRALRVLRYLATQPDPVTLERLAAAVDLP